LSISISILKFKWPGNEDFTKVCHFKDFRKLSYSWEFRLQHETFHYHIG